jgi:hypothetical protein
MACAAAGYGSKCFPARYTALACLTNILATQVGAAIQILLLSDSARCAPLSTFTFFINRL